MMAVTLFTSDAGQSGRNDLEKMEDKAKDNGSRKRKKEERRERGR